MVNALWCKASVAKGQSQAEVDRLVARINFSHIFPRSTCENHATAKSLLLKGGTTPTDDRFPEWRIQGNKLLEWVDGGVGGLPWRRLGRREPGGFGMAG